MLGQSTRSPESPIMSHNVLGQRLGRKGQETRERILAALQRQLEGPVGCPITLTSVAREASVGMTTLYLYFPDLGELVLAGMQRIFDQAKLTFVETVRTRWPDDELGRYCLTFTREYYDFWQKHGRILHLRNSLADANDKRFQESRLSATLPLIKMLVAQMDGEAESTDVCSVHFGMVLMTGLERIVTVITNPHLHLIASPEHADRLIEAEARLIEVALRHQRGAVAAARAAGSSEIQPSA